MPKPTTFAFKPNDPVKYTSDNPRAATLNDAIAIRAICPFANSTGLDNVYFIEHKNGTFSFAMESHLVSR